jgi:hypothetical protein
MKLHQRGKANTDADCRGGQRRGGGEAKGVYTERERKRSSHKTEEIESSNRGMRFRDQADGKHHCVQRAGGGRLVLAKEGKGKEKGREKGMCVCLWKGRKEEKGRKGIEDKEEEWE